MTASPLPVLFTPVALGRITLGHRVAMAPLTRLRADPVAGDVPTDLMVEHYTQRATAGGLIVSEATTVAKTGRGYFGAPGIYTDAQVDGWRKVTDAVHAKGGRIVLQLWHVGRTSHKDLADGQQPVGASALPYDGVSLTPSGWVPASPNRALETAELPGIVDAFRQGARRALAAGFDGVEVHGANGYLLDQFLQDNTNHRTDAYGGPVENRARLLLEVVQAVTEVWGADRVGVRLSPASSFNGMADSNPEATFSYAAQALDHFGLAYLHVVEPRVVGSEVSAEGMPAVAAVQLRQFFHGPIIAAGGFEPDTAEDIVRRGDADVVAFGRHFIANPDLPHRVRHGLALNAYDRSSFYGGGVEGYNDYPAYKDAADAEAALAA